MRNQKSRQAHQQALKKAKDGSTMTVDLKAKVKDAEAAVKFCEDFKSVVATFHSRVGTHELEDGVVLRQGVRSIPLQTRS